MIQISTKIVSLSEHYCQDSFLCSASGKGAVIGTNDDDFPVMGRKIQAIFWRQRRQFMTRVGKTGRPIKFKLETKAKQNNTKHLISTLAKK